MNQMPFSLPGRIQAASYDQSFLQDVKSGFDTLGLDPRMLFYILLVLVAAGVFYLLAWLLDMARRRRRSAQLPAYMIGEKQKISQVLQQAIDERSKFEMRFLPSDYTRPVALCTLLEFDAASLNFDLDPGVQLSKQWKERLTEFYFRIKGNKKQHIYYRFASHIKDVQRVSQSRNTLRVAFPDSLELQQKRAHLRLEPPNQYLLGIAVWREPSEPLPADVRQWGRPHLRFKPGIAESSVALEDLSAGGVRMLVTREALKKSKLDVSVGQRLYLMLDLYDPEASRKRRFLLLCRVQHVYEDFETRNVEWGLQFVSNGRLKMEQNQNEDACPEVEWKPVDQEGVEALGSWVMKRHLELYRDKGII